MNECGLEKIGTEWRLDLIAGQGKTRRVYIGPCFMIEGINSGNCINN